jgi:membrane peptidoglycan carboxypeptidase
MRRRTIVAVALLAILVLFVGGLVIYSARALSRFERAEARPADPPAGRLGRRARPGRILSRLGYRETKTAAGAGQFSRSDAAWDIQLAGAGAGRVALSVEGGRITRLRQGGAEVQSVALPPELLASAGADTGENIRPIHLPEVPIALRTAVLATEDVRFYEHGGVDPR